MEITISEMTTTTTPTGTYPFREIFHNQIPEWLPHILDSLKNSLFEVLNRHWVVGVDFFFDVIPKVAQDLDG